MNLSELFQHSIAPEHGWQTAAYDTQFAVEVIEGRKWLFIQGTWSYVDIIQDMKFGFKKLSGGKDGIITVHAGMLQCVKSLPLLQIGDVDGVAGHSLGGGCAQIYGLMAGVPSYSFGGPSVIYWAPPHSMDNSLQVLTRGDPIDCIPVPRWGGTKIKIGPWTLFARGKYHYQDYYTKCLKESPLGWLPLAERNAKS